MTYRSIVVYLGSSGSVPDLFKSATVALARTLAQAGIRIVYGGMSAGLMGLLAHESLLAGGTVYGVIPAAIRDSERVYRPQTPAGQIKPVQELWQRKKLMVDESDAGIVMPGGYGTIDEMFEFLYWAMIGLHKKPLVVLNIDGYWSPLLDLFDRAVRAGQLDARIQDFIVRADRVEDVIPALEAWVPPAWAQAVLESLQSSPDDILKKIEEENLSTDPAPIIIREATLREIYRLANALVLKQLGKHHHPIAVFDPDDIFKPLQEWVLHAAETRFITPNCVKHLMLFRREEDLTAMLGTYCPVETDLSAKWGEDIIPAPQPAKVD